MLRVLQAVEPAAKLSPPAVLSDGVCSEELLSGVEWLLVLHLGIARCGVDRLAYRGAGTLGTILIALQIF